MEIKDVQRAAITKPPIGKWIFVIAIFLTVIFGIWYFSRDLIGSGSAQPPAKKVTPTKKPVAPETLELSFYNNWVKFIPGASVKETYPEKEYVEVEVVQKNLSGADATKWVLENPQGERAVLGLASSLPLSGKVNATEPLKIKAGDHLFISTGRSPIGASFRVNKCSAYMEQFQDFIPPLSGECPYVSSEKKFFSLENACQSFIQGIRPCEANTRPFPSGVTASCKAFLDSTTNYNGCVATHKNDPDFYLKEWRVFLGKEKGMWSEPNDTIILLDDSGKLIDVFKY